jgi:hypothetical protein
MPAHYKYSPSASDRNNSCLGSMMGDVPERESSSYADEGTAAHELAAQLLEAGDDQSSVDEVLQESSAPDDMIEPVNVYVDFILDLRRDNDVLHEGIEEQLVSEYFLQDGEPILGGTLDYHAVYKDDKGKVWLHVVDLKYGQGVPVAVERNQQLLTYLMLGSEKYQNVKHFRMTLVQPRAGSGKPETIDVTAAELEEHEAKVGRAIKTMLEAEERGDDPENLRNAGPHCRWCPWAEPLRCQALYQLNLEAVSAQFPPLDEGPDEATEVEDVWVARWLALYKSADVIKGLLDAIPKWLLSEMRSGKEIPGFKVVIPKGHTKWVDEEEVTKKLQRRIGKKHLFTEKLKSPTQLRKEGYGDLIDKFELAIRPELPPKVVPDSDKRDAIVFSTPEEEFQFDMASFLES